MSEVGGTYPLISNPPRFPAIAHSVESELGFLDRHLQVSEACIADLGQVVYLRLHPSCGAADRAQQVATDGGIQA